MPDEGWMLTKEKIKEIVETWHLEVQPHLDGLNQAEAEEKLKTLPDVYEVLLKAQARKLVEWWEQPCSGHWHISHNMPHKLCNACIGELRKELGLEE